MDIYYKKKDDTYMLKKDLLEDLYGELGIKIESFKDDGKYTKEQEGWIEFILDEYIDEYLDVLSPEDLVENDEIDVLIELGVDYDIPEYREPFQGLFHDL